MDNISQSEGYSNKEKNPEDDRDSLPDNNKTESTESFPNGDENTSVGDTTDSTVQSANNGDSNFEGGKRNLSSKVGWGLIQQLMTV